MAGGPMYCENCGITGVPVDTMPGSLGVEILAWCWVLPGLIYTLWRRSNRKTVCCSCQSGPLLPLNSPKARSLQGRGGDR